MSDEDSGDSRYPHVESAYGAQRHTAGRFSPVLARTALRQMSLPRFRGRRGYAASRSGYKFHPRVDGVRLDT
jgi:hypothetical protein